MGVDTIGSDEAGSGGHVGTLFTLGSRSVTVTCRPGSGGRMDLLVNGPGSRRARYDIAGANECRVTRQQLEEALTAQGYEQNASHSERRSGRDRRQSPRGSDRRRP